MNRSLAIQQAKILKSLIELNKVSKILTTFIPAFKEKIITKEGKDFLCGSFNLNLVRKLFNIYDENKQMIVDISNGELKGFIEETLCRKSPKSGKLLLVIL